MSNLLAFALEDVSHKHLTEEKLPIGTFLQPSAGCSHLDASYPAPHPQIHRLTPSTLAPLLQSAQSSPANKATSEAAADFRSRVCVKLKTRYRPSKQPHARSVPASVLTSAILLLSLSQLLCSSHLPLSVLGAREQWALHSTNRFVTIKKGWDGGGGGKAKESVCLVHLFFRPHKTPHMLALPTDLPRCSCGVAGQVGDFLMNKNK